MATRFYLEADATTAPFPAPANPIITPAYDGAWGVTGGAARRWMTTEKLLTPLAATAGIAETSTTSGIDVLARQFISGPLAAQTIDGTVKGQIRVHESNADANMMAQVVIRVCSNDGTTILATLLAADTTAPEDASEFAITTGTNRKFPLAAISPATLTSYACAAGDRLLVEVGYQAHNTTATSRSAVYRFGSDGAADLAENETATTEDNPWVEFSDTITWAAVVGQTTQGYVESVAQDASPAARVTQAYIESIGTDPTPHVRVTQAYIEVVSAIPPSTESGTTGWGILLG